MSAQPEKFEIVDAHVHLWNLTDNAAWYPGMTSTDENDHAGIGDISGLCRDYLLPQYDSDTANYRVRKFVHVSATQGAGSYVGETCWLDGIIASSGRPHALIGAFEPAQSLKAIETELDAQQQSPLLRGVRVVFGLDPEAPATHDILRMLEERGLMLEVVTQPANALAFARLFEKMPNLRVVLEHAGWPTAPEEPGHFEFWRTGIAALAANGNMACKLSGLAMSLHSITAAAMRPWIEACIEEFGMDRCCFASNFPVDGLFGSFDDLYGAYREISAGLGAEDQRKLFAGNAERIYNI